MKIFVQNDNLGWIIDDIVKDYAKHTRHTISNKPDVAWSASTANLLDVVNYKVPIAVTLHHIDPLKLPGYRPSFSAINVHAKVVICPNKITAEACKKYIHKTTFILPYWLLSSRMEQRSDKVEELRNKIKTNDEIIIGSFQKDSEGDSSRPKLCKGPDIFLEVVRQLSKKYNIKVLLSGYSRKYLIQNFEERGIKYEYYKRYPNINDLYDVCDWYFVTSRVEGGPQAVLEAPYRGVKILSTRCGIAEAVLPEECLCNSVEEFVEKFEQHNPVDIIKTNIIKNFTPQSLIPKYDDLLESLL